MSKLKYSDAAKVIYNQMKRLPEFTLYKKSLAKENFSQALIYVDSLLKQQVLSPKIYAELESHLIQPIKILTSPDDKYQYNRDAHQALVSYHGLTTQIPEMQQRMEVAPSKLIDAQQNYLQGIEAMQSTDIENLIAEVRMHQSQGDWRKMLKILPRIFQNMKNMGITKDAITEIESQLLEPLVNASRRGDEGAQAQITKYTRNKLKELEEHASSKLTPKAAKGLMKILREDLSEAKKVKIRSSNSEGSELEQPIKSATYKRRRVINSDSEDSDLERKIKAVTPKRSRVINSDSEDSYLPPRAKAKSNKKVTKRSLNSSDISSTLVEEVTKDDGNESKSYISALKKLYKTESSLQEELNNFAVGRNWSAFTICASNIFKKLASYSLPPEEIKKLKNALMSPLNNAIKNGDVEAQKVKFLARIFGKEKLLEKALSEISVSKSSNRLKNILLEARSLGSLEELLKTPRLYGNKTLAEVAFSMPQVRQDFSYNIAVMKIIREFYPNDSSFESVNKAYIRGELARYFRDTISSRYMEKFSELFGSDAMPEGYGSQRVAISSSLSAAEEGADIKLRGIKDRTASSPDIMSVDNNSGEEKFKEIFDKFLIFVSLKKADLSIMNVLKECNAQTNDFGVGQTVLSAALESDAFKSFDKKLAFLIIKGFRTPDTIDFPADETAEFIGVKYPQILEQYKILQAEREAKQVVAPLHTSDVAVSSYDARLTPSGRKSPSVGGAIK